MSKLHLPKQIINDPKIREVFGSPKPLEPRRPFRSSKWVSRNPELKTCARAECRREFYAMNRNQKFCCKVCYFITQGRKNPDSSRYHCAKCGRYSRHLSEKKLCSFCIEKEKRFRHAIIVVNDRHKKHQKYYCLKCGKEITESENEVFHGLCQWCEIQAHYQKVEA